MHSDRKLPPSAEKWSPTPKTKLLLVDDRLTNLIALEAVLADLGQNLVKAQSGEEALRHVLVHDFAVILLDVQMQGLSGFETAELIRGREKSRHTPIIFITAYETPNCPLVDVYKLGAVDYLVKPVLPEVLRAKVIGFVELFRKRERLQHLERQELERKLADERRSWEMERLREESRHKDEFLAMLSHELRNPLASLKNAAQSLRLLALPDTALRGTSGVIERQVQHLVRLVDDLMDASRISRGRLPLQLESVELDRIVGRVLETSRPLIEARRHQLTVSLPPEPVRLRADPIRLAQVLANLLDNAAKYTEEGGRIGLTAKRAGNEVVLRVWDTGMGIPKELLPRIFDLYTQGDRSLDRSHGGLGIGLPLVRSLVEMHGGRISASSGGPGQGSEFVIHLSADSAETTPAPAPPEAGIRPISAIARRVLVVDDNHDAAESLAHLLRTLGHDVRTAHDAATALEAAHSFGPEVVVSDIGLPRMDGYELARRLREVSPRQEMLLVAMSGYGQEEDLRRSQEAGFDVHLVKPVDLKQLQEILALPRTLASKTLHTS